MFPIIVPMRHDEKRTTSYVEMEVEKVVEWCEHTIEFWLKDRERQIRKHCIEVARKHNKNLRWWGWTGLKPMSREKAFFYMEMGGHDWGTGVEWDIFVKQAHQLAIERLEKILYAAERSKGPTMYLSIEDSVAIAGGKADDE